MTQKVVRGPGGSRDGRGSGDLPRNRGKGREDPGRWIPTLKGLITSPASVSQGQHR